MKEELAVKSFKSKAEFNKWLKTNHIKSPGIWLRFYKKSSEIRSVNYQEALLEALCFGWIDGQAKFFDESSWIQRFTPRGPKSIWSKRNTELVNDLIKENKMSTKGLEVVENAKLDGRWDQAYSSQKNMVIPKDFLNELQKNSKAEVFFKTLNKTNLYFISFSLETAKKEETRIKRIKTIIEKLSRKEKLR